jgi:hypothetical protein
MILNVRIIFSIQQISNLLLYFENRVLNNTVGRKDALLSVVQYIVLSVSTYPDRRTS